MPVKDRATLIADLLTYFPDNTIGAITPERHRDQCLDMIESLSLVEAEDISALPAYPFPADGADVVRVYDDTAGDHKKLTLSDFYRLTVVLSSVHGEPSNMTLSGTHREVTGWGSSHHTVHFQDYPPSASTGIITLPSTGLYRINIKIVGQQGNSNKEESMFLGLFSTELGEVVVDVFDIATDKTDWRALGATFEWEGVEGEALSVRMWASANLGTFNFSAGTFEVQWLVEG